MGWFWQAKVTAITAEAIKRVGVAIGEISHPLGRLGRRCALGDGFGSIALADRVKSGGGGCCGACQRHVRFHAFFVRYYPKTGRD